MAISIKFTKFDNTPWGFRLAGGSDFPQPLTVLRVTEGSLAECMGLKVGDVVARLNDQSISGLTHGQAHEALIHAGNNFILGVHREEEARQAAEAISEENIVPYKIALADLPPVFPEQILKEETVIERYEEEEETIVEPLSAEEEIRQEENKLVEEKPVDANSEIVPNKNLTDDEIAQLILEEEELLSDKGLLGVNFKKLKPRAPILKDSKVLEELQHIATAEPERVQELKRTSTFLQRPQRPVPKSRNEPKIDEDEGETYRVVIKKQDKKTVIARLVEKGLLPPGSEATIAKTPEPPEVKMHETKKLEENRFPTVPDLDPSCSNCSLNNTDHPLSSPRLPESDSNEFLTPEGSPGCDTTYECKSKLQDKSNNSRRRRLGRYDEAAARSPFKGRYLENVLRGYARSCVPRDRQVDEVAAMKSGSTYLRPDGLSRDTRKRTSKCARAHYVERILLRNVGFVTGHFRARPKTVRVFASRMKGRYLATCLRRESIWLTSLITTLLQFLLQSPSASESLNLPKIRERRSSIKGRYLERILQKNAVLIRERVKETRHAEGRSKTIEEKKNEPRSTRTKGRYMEKCLRRQNLRLKLALTSLLDYAKCILENLFTVTSKPKHTKGRYLERLIRRYLEIFNLVVEYIRSRISEWLGEDFLCISRNEFSVVAVSTSSCIADDAILSDQQIDKDAIDLRIPEWHEDGPSCPLQKESFLIVSSSDNFDSSKEELAKSHDLSEQNPAPFEEADSAKSADVVAEEDALSKFMQSAENYISAETITPTATPDLTCETDQEEKFNSRPASKTEEEKGNDEVDGIGAKKRLEFGETSRPESCEARSPQDEQIATEEDSADPETAKANNEKIKQLVSTEISLEQQLETVQRQLLALKQLPREIESHLRVVSEQLHMIMELSGVQRSAGNGNVGRRGSSDENHLPITRKDDEELQEQEDTDEEEEFTETYDYIEEIACLERKTSSRSTPQVIEPSDDEGEMEEEEAETKELDGMISVKSEDEEGSRVKKFIVSYETKLIKSPSPAPSHGSFEPDPKLSPKDQVIQELQQKMQKRGRKQSQDLWPQAKQLELTQGRRWRCPNDFFNDEMIAEVLSCQAEVIRGGAMGVNFKKYEKTSLPNYDYLLNSSVYKMIHKMEREPKRGIPVRPAKVNAAEDIIKRIKSPALSDVDDRSARSVSH
ncbi:hypothetical protein PUN28_019490 [Cardiocondyla obscurior]|uniref:PDZ domain-containing protein n=2 Tax=Cardiocondyla obscurior TaxID=286306 RepID=A0AAW2ECT9_9HYME